MICFLHPVSFFRESSFVMAVLHAAPYSQPSVMGVTESPPEPFKFTYNPAFHMPFHM